ncbi:hypothetical protein Tco_1180791 [Tanacetum coccineum]
MFNMNERVYNQQSQSASVTHQVSMFHPQSSQVIHPQSYQVIHPQSSQVIHLQSSQAPTVSLQSPANLLQYDSGLVPYFLPTNDPLESFNKAYASRVPHLDSSIPMHTTTHRGLCPNSDEPTYSTYEDTGDRVDSHLGAYKVTTNAIFQSDGIDLYDSDCDEDPTAQASFMANISSYSSDVLFEAAVQDTNSSAQQDSMIKSVIEQMSEQMISHKAQRIKPTLYDGSVISSQHDVISVTDEEETLILKEVNRSKMLAKQNDLISKEKKINISPIDYSELNKLFEDFGKCFVPQMQLSAEQAFWLPLLNPNSEQLIVTQTLIRVEVPKELPKVIKDFENSLLNELNEVKMVFNQMEAAVDQCLVDKKLFEIKKKELKLENERMLQHIICQDVVNIVMHADVKSVNVLHVQNTFLDDNIALDVMKMENYRLIELLVSQDLVHTAVNSLAAINDYKSMEKSYIEEYERNLKLAAELSQMNELSKTCSRLEQQSQPQAKDTTISNLKKHIQELKGKNVSDCSESMNKPKVIALVVLKLDLEPLSSKLKNNREAHVDYIRITKKMLTLSVI